MACEHCFRWHVCLYEHEERRKAAEIEQTTIEQEQYAFFLFSAFKLNNFLSISFSTENKGMFGRRRERQRERDREKKKRSSYIVNV